jgi:hypothetical protein
MSDSDKLRERATRLFALALKARDHGFSSADDLADLANEALAEADEMDRRDYASARSPVTEAPQQVAQQQQQPQPDADKKGDS